MPIVHCAGLAVIIRLVPRLVLLALLVVTNRPPAVVQLSVPRVQSALSLPSLVPVRAWRARRARLATAPPPLCATSVMLAVTVAVLASRPVLSVPLVRLVPHLVTVSVALALLVPTVQ